MDEGFQRAIDGGEPHWALVFSVPEPVRLGPIAAAFRRLAARIVPEARLLETAEGLILWGRGEVEPASASRLASRLAELVPEAVRPVQRHTLPGASARLAALANPAGSWPAWTASAEPDAAAALSLRRTLSGLPQEAWIRRVPIVSVRPGVKARVVARRLVPDPAVVARALGRGGEEARPGEPALRLLDRLLLGAATRFLAGEERLVLALFPEAALGGGYDALEAAGGRAGLARIVPEVALADAVASPRAFQAARARFAADGQRLLLACPGAEPLGIAAALAAPGDLLSLAAEAARRAEAETNGSLARLGPERLLLTGCRSEADIGFGISLGIGLFEGGIVEALLASRVAA